MADTSKQDILLEEISLEDCTQTYVNWLNDAEINKYLESRWHPQTLETVREFVQAAIKNPNIHMFTIKVNNIHIGNIKLNISSERYKIADVGYIIGDKSYCNKGVATYAVKQICDYGFKELNLNKICAGVIDGNGKSQKVLQKLGFKLEGYFREHNMIDGCYKDTFQYAVLKSEWMN